MSGLLEELRAALPEQYQVEAEIGRGGMATVFVAEDVKHGRRVAIKVLTPELSTSLGAERFLREIQVSARLSHPHILPVFDSGEANGLLYYVMPFVEGESLRARLAREQQFSIADAITIACEIADALSYAHGMGIVHRDIKPENVLLHGGHAVVADFGIARLLYDVEDGGRLTSTGSSIGTATYMSPEQFSGLNVDGRSDQYSLACLLYEMLVGQVPFTGPNAMAIMARHTMEAVPSIRVVRATVPDELEGVIMRALEKVPADRFATMQQFKDAIIDGAAGSSFAPRTTRYSIARMTVKQRASGGWQGTSTRARIAMVAALLLVAVGGGFAAKRYWFDAPPPREAGGLDPHEVAVLYFDDQSRDGQLRYLADGLTESLIDALSDVRAIHVVSRNGVARFRGGSVPIDSVARALHAGSIVTGFVEPTRDGVNVQVELKDGGSGARLDARAFALRSADIGAVRDSVTLRVRDFLRRALGTAIDLAETRSEAQNLRAWTLVQRGEKRRKDADSLFASDSGAAFAALDEADTLLAAAAREDPAWSKAPSLRAAVAYLRARALRRRPTEAAAAIDSGMAHANRAIALDPRDADALELRGELSLQRVAQQLVGDDRVKLALLDSAESDLKRATEINPSQATAHAALSRLYYSSLRPNLEQAQVAAVRAYESDAFLRDADYILTRLFWTNYDNRAFPEASRWCGVGTSRFPRNPFFVECHLWMMTSPTFGDDGDKDPRHAWMLYDRLGAVLPARDTATALRRGQILVAGALARAALADSARAVLLRARLPEGSALDPELDLVGYEAVIRVMLGDQDEAVRLITKYVTRNPDHLKGFAGATRWWWRDLDTNRNFRALIAGAR